MILATVGQLKSALALLDDDMPIKPTVERAPYLFIEVGVEDLISVVGSIDTPTLGKHRCAVINICEKDK